MRDVPFIFDLPAGELEILRAFAQADFDPVTGSMAVLSLVGAAATAAGTLMGGANAAAMGQAQARAAQFQRTQDIMNSASDIASGQRKMFNTQLQTNLTQSRAVASAASGGVETTTGSPLVTQAQIGARGRYASDIDLFNGENEATGDLNKAVAADYQSQLDIMGGKETQEASYFTAAGTLMQGGASAYKIYGMNSGTSSAFLPSSSFAANGIGFEPLEQ